MDLPITPVTNTVVSLCCNSCLRASFSQENTELRNKERDSHDTLTDLKSKVAIMTADKERFYQEKSDLTKEIDRLSLLHRQIQDVSYKAIIPSRANQAEGQCPLSVAGRDVNCRRSYPSSR